MMGIFVMGDLGGKEPAICGIEQKLTGLLGKEKLL